MSNHRVSWRKLVGVEPTNPTCFQCFEWHSHSLKSLEYHVSQKSSTPGYKTGEAKGRGTE
jgi:hypothetical protein